MVPLRQQPRHRPIKTVPLGKPNLNGERDSNRGERTERKPWLHYHVTLEGSPPCSGPQAGMLYDYDIPITVCVLMALGRQIRVRRVDGLRKTKDGLAAGQ